MLFMFLLAISIPAIVIGALAIRNSTDQIVKQSDLSSKNLLNEKKSFVEQQMSEVVNISNQILSSDEVWRLFDRNATVIEKHKAMRGVTLYLLDMTSANEGLESIYLYNEAQNYVLYDSKYQVEEFIDSAVLNADADGTAYVTPPRKLAFPASYGKQVISYVRSFRIVATNETLWLYINIKYDEFAGKLQAANNPYALDLLIIDQNDELIVNRASLDAQWGTGSLIELRNLGDDDNRHHFAGRDYYISKTDSDILGWTFVYMKPYSELVGNAKLLRNIIIISVCIVLVLSSLMALGLSKYLYRPLAKLITEIRLRMSHETDQKMDEYKIIDRVFQNLFHENRELQNQFAETFPILKQYALQELITGKVLDDARLNDIIEMLGMDLSGAYFTTAIMEFNQSGITDQTYAAVESWLNQREIVYVISALDDHHIAVVINSHDNVYNLLNQLLDEWIGLGFDLSISASKPFDSLAKAGLNYREAMIQLNRKFFNGGNQLFICEQDDLLRHSDSIYDRTYEDKLLNAIRSQDEEKALSILRELIATLPSRSDRIEFIKYGINQFVSHLTDSLSEIGCKLLEDGTTEQQRMENIHQAKTLQELEQYLIRFVRQCVADFILLKQKQHTETIDKTKSFIRAHYHKDISVKDISDHVFLSPNYLSAVFKSETGITIFDYITQVRLESALDLLRNPEMKIQDISQAVGYNNVQSFIRFFKKEQKMTPLEFRRSIVPS
jgi:AraC-like DNA-binding protein